MTVRHVWCEPVAVNECADERPCETGKTGHCHRCNPYEGHKFDEDRIQQLFHELDVDHDGRIDIDELSEGLHSRRVLLPGQAEKLLKEGDVSGDHKLSYDEFMKLCLSHEQKLWLVFKQIDTDNTGTITLNEIVSAFDRLGENVTVAEVKNIFQSLDRNDSQKIEWDEWRDVHFLNSQAHSVESILKLWKHSSFIDIGDDLGIPDDFTEEEKVTGMWWRQLVAGGVAGVVSRTCTAPLDRLKVLLQLQAGTDKQRSIVEVFKKMLRVGGVRSLWQGNAVNTIKIAPESAIKFFAYENIKKFFADSDGKLSTPFRLIAGSLAGVCSQTAIYPMEVMKTRLAIAKPGQYNGMVGCAMNILRTDGVRGFYRGLTPGLIGIVPYAGIDLCVYETLKQKWLSTHEGNPSNLVLLLCGSTASVCGQVASYPLALVRTKLQAITKDPGYRGPKANGMVEMFQLIVKETGYTGLYRGLLPNFMKVLPAVSISYIVYENGRRKLGMSSR